MDIQTIQFVRYALGLSWIYHGLFPKLIHIAPLEQQITATLGFSDSWSYFITKSAGVGEIIFGLLLIIFYKNKHIMLLNICALIFLCGFVAIQAPALLIEAFNPVTTNLPLIALSVVLLRSKHI